MDILSFVFLVIAVLAGLITLVIELFHHAAFGKALILAVSYGFVTYIVVAFGTTIFVVAASAISDAISQRKK